MATYSDSFNSLVSGSITGQGYWLSAYSGITVYRPASDGEVYPNSAGNRQCAYYNNYTDNNQYAQAVITTISSAYIGVAVRVGTGRFYSWYGNSTGSVLGKMVSGVWTELDTGNAFTTGNIIRLEIEGTTLSCYKNGVLDSSIGTGGQYTDSSISSGYVGISGYNNSLSSRIDSWEGGDLPVLYLSNSSGYSTSITVNTSNWKSIQFAPNYELYSGVYYTVITGGSFNLLQVNLYARLVTSGTLTIKLCTSSPVGSGTYGGGTLVYSTTVDISGWSTSFAWRTINLPQAVVLANVEYHLILGFVSSGELQFGVEADGGIPAISSSADGGSSWTSVHGNAPLIELYGTDTAEPLELPTRFFNNRYISLSLP